MYEKVESSTGFLVKDFYVISYRIGIIKKDVQRLTFVASRIHRGPGKVCDGRKRPAHGRALVHHYRPAEAIS